MTLGGKLLIGCLVLILVQTNYSCRDGAKRECVCKDETIPPQINSPTAPTRGRRRRGWGASSPASSVARQSRRLVRAAPVLGFARSRSWPPYDERGTSHRPSHKINHEVRCFVAHSMFLLDDRMPLKGAASASLRSRPPDDWMRTCNAWFRRDQ